PAVQRAWRALAAHVASDATLVDVCAGTGAGPTKRYYFDRPAVTGADDRGGAMAVTAALGLLDLNPRRTARRRRESRAQELGQVGSSCRGRFVGPKRRGTRLRDAPAVAAERVHQLHRPLDQLSRFVDFFDRFRAVRFGDDDLVAAGEPIVRDFVTKLFAVAI